jgi:hypothetical protein
MKRFTEAHDTPEHSLVAIPKTEGGGGLRLSIVPAGRKGSHRSSALQLQSIRAHSGASYPVVLGEAKGKGRKRRR